MPGSVRGLAGDGPLRAVWVNPLGGLTFEIGGGAGRRFVKWAPHGSGLDLAAEEARMRWAVAYTPVPRVLEHGSDAEGAWLVTEALPGESAVLEPWRAQPERAVRAIGEGLRALHQALPVRGCPFSWSAEERLAEAEERFSLGSVEPAGWHPELSHLSPEQALEILADRPPPDHLVVCHGDACAPNTLLEPSGRWLAHVDLGRLGVADRWADLAVATWSTTWNYGPGWELALLEAYGIDPDPERTFYYRLLWEVSS